MMYSTTTMECMARPKRRRDGFAGQPRRLDGKGDLEAGFRARLADTVSEWLMVAGIVENCTDDDGRPIAVNRAKAGRLERKIRTMLDQTPGTVYGFAGLSIWADADTPAGKVRHFDPIDLT